MSSASAYRDKVIVITGAGSGIGRCTAHELASLGATVALVGRDLDKLGVVKAEIEATGMASERITVHACDIRKEEQVIAMVDEILARHGRIDALVNNAGGQYRQPLDEISSKGFEAVVRLNLFGGFMVMREVYNRWMNQHGGAIVNMIADIWGGWFQYGHSGAARGGMWTLSETAASEWAHSGVRVNCVAPGGIASSGFDTYEPDVQADILKEDQAQNTCIFSTEFALRMMGDIQQYFVDKGVRNFYSVSISGYHIAEAGANPISQLAFTLSNGFTIVEYYLARGMKIDDFAPNLSFFFSNGMDPEYTVIGRVARRIWARAMRERYGASSRSQMMKYHIQTSGRSLHAQEIQFNDIRTTLQALYALFDNCNSLHTNAYDEAITTPTEESVRRAVAIQMIINKELGLNFCENPWQGSFIVDKLTDIVEEAVYKEFEAISERGGVLGAMDTMYQRGKIQEESLYYEHKKHDGSLPLVGVNTFLPKDHGGDIVTEIELIRSTEGEKGQQIENVRNFQQLRNEVSLPCVQGRAGEGSSAEGASSTNGQGLTYLQKTARERKNVFESLMEAVKTHSLGQISHALYEVGGEYRRNM